MRVVTMQPEELQLLRIIAAAGESEGAPAGGDRDRVCNLLAEYGLVVRVEGRWTVTARGHRTVVRTAHIPVGASVDVAVFDPRPVLPSGD